MAMATLFHCSDLYLYLISSKRQLLLSKQIAILRLQFPSRHDSTRSQQRLVTTPSLQPRHKQYSSCRHDSEHERYRPRPTRLAPPTRIDRGG